MKLLIILILIVGNVGIITANEFLPNYTCNSIVDLGGALYKAKNLLSLTQVFYPPRKPPVQFVRVKYIFESNGTDNSKCNVTYLWAKGGFLLIQPPSVFRFTSLFFNFDENTKYDLQLTLPGTCRPLVYTDSTSDCSCHSKGDDFGILDMVTHQVSNTIA